MANLLLLINILSIILCSNRFLIQESKENIIIQLQRIHYTTMGRKGTLVMAVNTEKGFPINYEKITSFEIKLSDKYKVKCGTSYIFPINYIFCLFDESIPAGEYELNLEGFIFETDKYIYSWEKKQVYTLNKLDIDIIDLYSNEQSIVIDKKENEDTNSYFLKFNISSSYNNERIFVSSHIILDNCKQQKNELVCPITRNQILATGSLYQLFIQFLNHNKMLDDFWLVPNVKVAYRFPKEDIYVGITKLIEKNVYRTTFVVYETNVTDMINIRPQIQSFFLDFETEDGKTKYRQICTLRKYDNNPLYLLCKINEGTYRLSEIKETTILDVQNLRYNFLITPTNNKEFVYCNSWVSNHIKWVYPEILDFTKKDTWTIEFYENGNINGFSFNEDAQDLSCESYNTVIKCIVPKSHFEGKKTGFYFTKHRDESGGKSISYEIPPIKVILSKSDSDLIGHKISFYFIYSFILLVLLFL